MKPFLLIQSRPENDMIEHEYGAFLHYGGLTSKLLVSIRVEQNSLNDIKLSDYSGIFIGGSPFNVSDPEDSKSTIQKCAESELFHLINQIVHQDFPLLATCYGVGLLTKSQGGVVSTQYGEQMDAVNVVLNQNGQKDPITKGLAPEFSAFVAHKEACEVLPKSAVLLASSVWCPVHMFKIKNNVYATQFHPEWDALGLEIRVKTYLNHGYFPAEEAENIISMGYKKVVTEPEKILRNFVETYSTSV